MADLVKSLWFPIVRLKNGQYLFNYATAASCDESDDARDLSFISLIYFT